MATHLYRRNGRFYARLRVPLLLVDAYGKSHLRASLDTADHRQARLRVLEVVLGWKRDFLRVQAMLDACKVVAGSALLFGDGLMTIESAARECGLRVDSMLKEAINRAVELRIEALGWQGSDVPANELETDFDGSMLPNDTLAGRELGAVLGTLFTRREALALIYDGLLTDCVFFRDAARRRAVVFLVPGVAVPVGALLVAKQDVEAIRAGLAAHVTPVMLDAADKAKRAAQPAPAPVSVHKYGGMRASALMSEFFKAKLDWSPATKIQMTGMCGVFVELMQDPALSDIDGVMLLEYRKQLLTLPADIYQARRRLKVDSLAGLVVASAGLPRMLEARADAYVAKVGEMFAWAARKGFMATNPAVGAVERKKKTTREQDARHEFSHENLCLIFSAPWFVTGKGERSASGKFWRFQPYHYWLPLLGLFTGGRLNELAQLHLSDIQRTTAGVWFVNFSASAVNADEPAKRLKTVNSIRQVPLHPELVRLGLPKYTQALVSAGYDRLFPELRFDRVKGYGKAAGQWFDEKFLGNRLEIPRDGMQTFHSFRHNFISALTRLDPPLGEFVINQLSGHERGETMSANRYTKDQSPDILEGYITRLSFNIPVIESFDIDEGLQAVLNALKRKVKPG